MKKSRKILSVGLSILLAGHGLPLRAQSYFQYQPEGTLCHKGETILFSCNLDNGTKVVSVCAGPRNGLPFGDLRYRSKTSGQPELDFPEGHEPAASFATGNMIGYGRGTLAYISLHDKGATYSAYSFGSYSPPNEGGGIIVATSEKAVTKTVCDHDGHIKSGELFNNNKLFGVSIPFDKNGAENIRRQVGAINIEPSPSGQNLCSPGETTLFSCGIGEGKVVSVCASPDNETPFGDVRYRFKAAGRPEFEFPSSYRPAKSFASGNVLPLSTSETMAYISMRNGDTTYSAFDINLERGGILVTRHGALIAKLKCNDGLMNGAENGAELYDDELFGVSVPRDDAGYNYIKRHIEPATTPASHNQE